MKGVLVAALAAAVLAACGQERVQLPVLAVAVPLSGPLAADGQGIVRAVKLALEERPGTFELATFDDQADPEKASEMAQRIVADPRVVGVIGHLTSGCSIEAAKVYGPAGLAMVTPAATATELTLQQTRPEWRGPRVVFRLPPSDAVQGAYAAQYAFSRFSLRRIWVIDDQTPYGRGLADEFSAHFQRRGGEIGGRDAVDPRQPDWASVIAKVKGGSVDGVFFGGVYMEAAQLVKRLVGSPGTELEFAL